VSTAAHPSPVRPAVAADLAATRAATLRLVAGLGDDELHRPLAPIMSPLVWDLGHIAAYEDLWCGHRLGGLPLLRPELAAVYDAAETPRAARADAPLLDRDGALAYLDAVRARTLAGLDAHGPSELHELVLRHELQHTETMRQALFLGGLPGGRPAQAPRFPGPPSFVDVPAGAFVMGAPAGGFAYDNERPAHAVHTGAFRIARAPVTGATFLTFAEGGGYERREWWSDEGWAWKQEHDIAPPDLTGPPDAPVQHVSWYEADALARSLAARLPTETEWERAVTWMGGTALRGIGFGWEWTASELTGYPGFRAHPYREYSEVFFDRGFRVLRGGSWATSPRVASPTFRNWDLPERRQLFAGVRLAADA